MTIGSIFDFMMNIKCPFPEKVSKNMRSGEFFLENVKRKKENERIIFRLLFSYFLGILNY